MPWFRATHPSRADEDKTLTFVPFWPESLSHSLKIITKIEIKRQLHGQTRSFSFIFLALDSPVRFFSRQFLSPYLVSNEGLRRFRKRKKFQDERMRKTEREKYHFLSPIFMSDSTPTTVFQNILAHCTLRLTLKFPAKPISVIFSFGSFHCVLIWHSTLMARLHFY